MCASSTKGGGRSRRNISDATWVSSRGRTWTSNMPLDLWRAAVNARYFIVDASFEQGTIPRKKDEQMSVSDLRPSPTHPKNSQILLSVVIFSQLSHSRRVCDAEKHQLNTTIPTLFLSKRRQMFPTNTLATHTRAQKP